MKKSKNGGSTEYEQAIDFLGKGCGCGCSTNISQESFAELREAFSSSFQTRTR